MEQQLNKILYGQFYDELSEGIFRVDLFNSLNLEVVNFFRIGNIMNTKDCASLWEFYCTVQILIKSHYNPNDIYKIKGMDYEVDYQVTNIMHYLCNSLSFNKEIEINKITFGAWR